MRAAVDAEMIEYRSASVAVPPMAYAVVGHVYLSRTVVRPDSSTSLSSIRGLCRNTPSDGLVGAAPLGVASVYGHSPFVADFVPDGENLHGVHHTCSPFHTHPLRNM